MDRQRTFLVFGATGQTGRHFTSTALGEGDRVKALVRTPSKLGEPAPGLEVRQGSVTDADLDLDGLLAGVDFVVAMIGDAAHQRTIMVNTAFVQRLVPAMRRQGVTRFLYQAGGLSTPPGQRLPPQLRLIRATIARGYIGQHEDNEAVMRYLADDASDIEWIVHRAGIGSDGPSRGQLYRSDKAFSIATFRDCANYNYRTIQDPTAVHTSSLSRYRPMAS